MSTAHPRRGAPETRQSVVNLLLGCLAQHPGALDIHLCEPGGDSFLILQVPPEGETVPAPPARQPASVPEHAPVVPRRPRKRHNRQLRGAILDVLYEAEERLTCPEIVEAIGEVPDLPAWAEKTIERCLLDLVREGTIENGKDERGHGYALL